MEMHPQTIDPRSAGKVARWHTWEHLRGQSVGEHTWQLVRILLALWPDCPRDLLVKVMFHDAGERVTGDIPYPVKSENEWMKVGFDRLEQEALGAMLPWGVPPTAPMTDHERDVVKLAEFIEMWEWALDEVALGNRNAILIRDRCHAALERQLAFPAHSSVRNRAVDYMQRRINHVRKHGLGYNGH